MIDSFFTSLSSENSPILDNRFKVIEKLGEGRFAKVKIAIEIRTHKKVAIKIMKESGINSKNKIENFIKEIEILSELNSPYIIKLYHINLYGEYCKSDGRIKKVVYYVMELEKNCELFDFLDLTDNFPESLARFFFKQLIAGIEYLHTNSIVHRDIKPENLLFSSKFQLKIADFSYSHRSRHLNRERIYFSCDLPVGSPEYNPPEIANAKKNDIYFGEDADIFASGVVLFAMVMKSSPFVTSNFEDKYYSRLISPDTNNFWKIFEKDIKVGSEFKDLIEKILEKNPKKRFTLQNIKEHAWFKLKTPTENEVFIEMEKRSSTVLENLAQKIKQRKYSRAKKFGNFERNIEKNTEFERILRKYVLTVQMINKKLENRDVKAKHLNKKYSYSSENLIINKNIVFHDDLMLEILKRHID